MHFSRSLSLWRERGVNPRSSFWPSLWQSQVLLGLPHSAAALRASTSTTSAIVVVVIIIIMAHEQLSRLNEG
jgi:membrane protein insertase Oxa1/YidC/SpoIIIJ